MELYNFFSKPAQNEDEIIQLHDIFGDLSNIPDCNFELIQDLQTGYFSIIGQLYGEDSNLGDTDLLAAFAGYPYTYINAFHPEDNNIKN